MTTSWSNVAFGLALVTIALFAIVTAQPYDSELAFGNNEDGADFDYLDSIRDLIHQTPKRAGRLCIRGGKSCYSAARNLCCAKFECRCNLFGTNCKCERPGLFGLGRK